MPSDQGRFTRLDFSEQGAVQPPHAPEIWPDTTAVDCIRAADDHFARAHWGKALECYSRALRFERESRAAWLGQARCELEQEHYPEATTWSARALERFAGDPDLTAARGLAMCLAGDLLGRGILLGAIKPDASAWVYIYHARALALQDKQAAERSLDKAATLCSGDAVAMLHAGRTFVDARMPAKGLALLRQVAVSMPDNAYARYQLGRAYEASRDETNARLSFERALVLEPLLYPARDGLERIQQRNPLHRFLRRRGPV